MRPFLFLVVMVLAVRPGRALNVERRVLDNGLVVIIYEDHALPRVTSYLWYKVGSADEGKDKSGFAHLFEHFMFEGSRNVRSGTILNLGDRGCYANASTSFDRTDYVITCPREMLEEMMRLESDRMGFLQSGMTQQSFEKQRSIVINEKRQGDNRPYADSNAALYRGVYPKEHPYAKLPIGSAEDLNAASVDDAKRFHSQYYWPNNAVLVIAGDQNSRQTLRMVEKWFGGLKSGPVPPRPEDRSGNPPVARQSIIDPKASWGQIIIAWRVPAAGQPGNNELGLLGALLTGRRIAPFVADLMIKNPLFLDVSADLSDGQFGGMFTISATPAPGVSLKQAEKMIDEELAAVLAEPLDGGRLKGMIKRAETARLDSMQIASNLVGDFAYGEVVAGDPLKFEKGEEDLRMMDVEKVRQAALKYLIPANRSVLTLSPRQEDAQ